MKLFLSPPIEGSPVGSVAAKVEEYLRHKLHFSETFDEDDPESRLEFWGREAMTCLAIVQCLLAEHPELHDEVCAAEGEMRGDIEHSRAEFLRPLAKKARRAGVTKPRRRSKATARKQPSKSRTVHSSKPHTELSRAGREVIARAARKRWDHWRAEQRKGGKISGS